MTRALIINGDDFGLTPGVNAGILEAHARGILTSASVFANASATDDALGIARRTPTLGVGCHLALVDGVPLLPASQVPSLAPDGRFFPGWQPFIRAALSRRIALVDVERELTAQLDRVTSARVQPTHLDSHKHVHAYPPIFEIVARLARRFGIATVRVPCEASALRRALRFSRSAGAARQAIENLALVPWARSDRRTLTRHSLCAPHFVGRALTGLFTPASFRAELRGLPSGTSELMVHPGYVDVALDQVRTRLRRAREVELAILTDPASREALAAQNIRLTRHGAHAPSRVQPYAS
jgi:chitin disaccharide deacetylase